MDDIATLKSSFSEQAIVFVRKHNWILSWLYLGTFGSFIGFAAGFPLLADIEFNTRSAVGFAFAGPLAAAIARPAGGWLADRVGGGRVALASFVIMGAASGGLLATVPSGGSGGSYAGFLALFAVLFLASGAGNGAVFQMIPVVFVSERERSAGDPEARRLARHEGVIEGGAAIGFASAIGAFGGFVIPKSFGTAIALTGGTHAAIYMFIVFYATCVALTWWFYVRKDAEVPC
jgi:NNP family nitrate/nitrite transporter-like MFS transporter